MFKITFFIRYGFSKIPLFRNNFIYLPFISLKLNSFSIKVIKLVKCVKNHVKLNNKLFCNFYKD